MATLTAGYIYLIESEAGDNQNWLTDPETIVIGNFTEGDDFCKFSIPRQWIQNGSTGIKQSWASSGTGFQERTYRRGYLVEVSTIEPVGNIDLIDSFIMGNTHCATSGSTFKAYYMVIKRATNDYVLFMDDTGTQQEYLKGVIPDNGYKITWNESQNLNATIQLKFVSGW